MKTWVHFLVSSILAIIFYPVFNWKVLFILVGGVLIDIDHYVYYIFKYKKFGIFECYRLFTEEGKRSGYRLFLGIFLIFHTIEFALLVLALSFFNELALLFIIGLASHYILDIIWQYSVLNRLIINPSAISWLYKNKIQKV